MRRRTGSSRNAQFVLYEKFGKIKENAAEEYIYNPSKEV